MKCARPACRAEFQPNRNRRYCSDLCARATQNEEDYKSYDAQREAALFERFKAALEKNPDLENWQLMERFGLSSSSVSAWRVAVKARNTTAAHREG